MYISGMLRSEEDASVTYVQQVHGRGPENLDLDAKPCKG